MAENISQTPDNAVSRITSRIAASNMARWMQMSVTQEGDDLLFRLGFDEEHIGNPMIRALHGGVISSFLDSCAMLKAYAMVPEDVQLTTTSVHTSYLTSSRPEDMLCIVTIRRLGRRFAFLEADGWQQDKSKLVARSAVGIRIIRPEE